MIGHKRIPGREGGVEVAVEELSKELVGLGCEVVAYNRYRRGAETELTYEGVELSSAWTIETKKLDALIYSYVATVKALLARVDLIHYHAIGPAASLWLAKLFGAKVVVSVHGFNYKTPKWKGMGAKYLKFGERMAAKYADEVIALSDVAKDYFEKKYSRVVRVIPNGVRMPSPRSASTVERNLGLSEGDYFLNVSRLVPGKGIETLVSAFSRLDCDKHLVVAGDCEYDEEFKAELIKLAERDPRIHFVGFVRGDELASLYANAFAFVFPSEAEGMPISLLEAMWFNCLCVVSNIDENVEVLGDQGIYFDVGDVNSLISALEAALSDSGAFCSRKMIDDKYNWSIVAEETLEMYESIVEDKNNG